MIEKDDYTIIIEDLKVEGESERFFRISEHLDEVEKDLKETTEETKPD